MTKVPVCEGSGVLPVGNVAVCEGSGVLLVTRVPEVASDESCEETSRVQQVHNVLNSVDTSSSIRRRALWHRYDLVVVFGLAT